MSEARKQVSVRLPEEHQGRLEEQAARAKTTPTAYARHLLIQALEKEDGGAELARHLLIEEELMTLREEVSALSTEVRLARDETQKTRADLYNGLVLLLRTAGGMQAEEVTRWADQYLHQS